MDSWSLIYSLHSGSTVSHKSYAMELVFCVGGISSITNSDWHICARQIVEKAPTRVRDATLRNPDSIYSAILYNDFTKRKGNSKTALIALNTTSNVNPTIRKGSSSNQTKGKRKSIIRASGQQITKSRHHNTKARKILIVSVSLPYANSKPTYNSSFRSYLRDLIRHNYPILYSSLINSVQSFVNRFDQIPKISVQISKHSDCTIFFKRRFSHDGHPMSFQTFKISFKIVCVEK